MPVRPIDSPPLFPPFVAQHSLVFDVNDARDLAVLFPGIELPATLFAAVRKRQFEFLAGRSCAREALRRCAPELVRTPIGSGRHREPLWPPGIVGSVTHCLGYASVALARRNDAVALGLDAECWLQEDDLAATASQIASNDELKRSARDFCASLPRALTLIFSAKETLFKCLFHEVRRYWGFLDAVVENIDVAGRQFTVRLHTSLAPGLSAGSRFTGRFELGEERVYTGMALTRPRVTGALG
jgi:enterobactin synthetase component D